MPMPRASEAPPPRAAAMEPPPNASNPAEEPEPDTPAGQAARQSIQSAAELVQMAMAHAQQQAIAAQLSAAQNAWATISVQVKGLTDDLQDAETALAQACLPRA